MNPLSPSGCSLLIREPGAPVVQFRSAEIAVPVRINGARIAVRVRACGARVQRVFAVIQKWVRDLLHADQFGIGASHELGILTQEYGNV